MGIGESAGDLVGSGITRRYPKFRLAVSRRHGSSPAASTATNNDVPATSRWRSSHVVCDARKGTLLETALSQLTPFLRDHCHPNRGGVHVQPGLARAGTALENDWLGVGLQHRVDDCARHREAWTLSHSRSCSFVEAMVFEPLRVSITGGHKL